MQVKEKQISLSDSLQKTETLLRETQQKWQHLLPAHIDPEQTFHLVMNVLRQNPELLNCSQPSFWGAIIQTMKLGLRPDGVMGEAYLVPFKGTVKLFIGYKGLIALARRSGDIAKITASVVREGDDFAYVMGDEEKIVHTPNPSPTRGEGAITHAYVIITQTNGEKVRLVMDAAAIDAHKQRYAKGASKKDSAWHTAEEQMTLKTVLRKMLNSGMIPLSTEVSDTLNADDSIEPLGFSDLSHSFNENVIDAEAMEVGV